MLAAHHSGQSGDTPARSVDLVVGLGEVGRPLLGILSRHYPVVGKDLEAITLAEPCSVMHICFPCVDPPFFGKMVADYVHHFCPRLVMIHSTVTPGTCRAIQDRLEAPVSFSPVRGKHFRMESDLLRYVKFVSAFSHDALVRADTYLGAAGFRTQRVSSPEAAELMKTLETTYFGLLIAWAQEVERLAKRVGAPYEEIVSYFAEVDFLPSGYTPGFIGGHCVIQNIRLLKKFCASDFFEVILRSNARKEEGLERERSPQA